MKRFVCGGKVESVPRLSIVWVLSWGIILSSHVQAMVIREGPVRLRVLEYSSKNGSLQKVLNSRYSDLVVGEEVDDASQLVLECSSRFGPLRWIYNGDGRPQFKSYYTSTTRAGTGSRYTAYLSFPNGVVPKDTGQYLCQNSYNGSISNYVYLFVPKRNIDGKQAIFVPNFRKHEIPVLGREQTVRIPCSVVHPNVKVSVERSSVSKSFYLDDPIRVPYNPKTGFTIPVSPVAKETYTCRGEFRGSYEEVTYTTVPVQPRIDPEAEVLEDHFFTRLNVTSVPTLETSTYPLTTTSYASTSTTSQAPRVPKLPPPEKHLVSACTPQYCGTNAECIVKDYTPYCVCLEDFTGDAKIGCHKISDHSQHLRVEDPCHPSPCGKNAECVQINGHPLCTCLAGYYGTPPKCSPNKFTNCTKNYDCEWTEYCNTDTLKCEDICEGSTKFCGKNAICTAFSHMPYCTCPPGGSYVGDPYDTEGSGCQQESEKQKNEGKPSCNPSPCGRNAHCKVYSSYPLPICFCPQGFTGDPSHRCYKHSPAPIIDVFRPHYNTHPPPRTTTTTTTTTTSPQPPPSFPPLETAAIPNFSFDNPFHLCTPQFCGENARCRFRNNNPECHCLSGYNGDPYKGCFRTTLSPSTLRQACSVCGPNSVCSMISADVRCICAPDTVGAPPNCRKVTPSSSASSEYENFSGGSSNSQQVQVVTTSISSSAHEHHHQHSSSSTSHRLSSSSKNKNDNVRQRERIACSSDLDCPDNLVCYTGKEKCLNPCSWACSDSALCTVTNHHVQCRCPIGYTGNPRLHCAPLQPEPQGDQQQNVHETHPCRFTCGPHSICRRISPAEMRQLRRQAFSRQENRGPFQKALVQYIKRVQSQLVSVSDNFTEDQQAGSFNSGFFTECVCMAGASGNPYSIEGCSFHNNQNNNHVNSNHNNHPNHNDFPFNDDLEDSPSHTSSAIAIPTDPCKPKSPCGAHSLCVAYKGQAFCRCDYDSVGVPPDCTPRCAKHHHCLFNQVCFQGKCVAQSKAAGLTNTNLHDQKDSNFIRKKK